MTSLIIVSLLIGRGKCSIDLSVRTIEKNLKNAMRAVVSTSSSVYKSQSCFNEHTGLPVPTI